MKAKLLLFISLISVSLFAQNVNIPDINFKQALLNDNNINTVDDGEISFSEAENATSITAIELEIEDLTGVEAFINLTLLEVSRNKIANIDITPLTKLTRLYVDRNLLTEIELGYNTILEELYVDANHLTSLNVKNNTSLIRLWAKGNNYTEICVWDIEFAENLESSEFFNKDASVDWTTDCICVCSYVLTLSDVSFENGTISNFVNDTEKSIIIPSELDGQPVTSIASSTFYNKDLTCVDIPKGITSIGAHAFWGNKLKNIKIPPGVTVINEWSFSYNELDSIDISDNVTKIDRFAFLGNNLKSVNLPDGVDIKAAAFNDNIINTVNGKNSNGTFFKRYNAVISIVSYGGGNTVIESDIITTEVTSLGNYAFTRNKLNSVVIPNNITSIGEHCFSNNNIKKAVLPINIDEIQKGTFLDNELTSIEIPSRVRYIGEYAFSDNELVTIVLPDGIKDIKKWAFYSNKLTSIIIPNSATRIEGGVFNSNKITSINGEASNGIVYGYFDNEEINIYKIISYGGEKDIVDFIPEIVTHIGTNAFARNNISSVIIPDNILSIGVTSFQYNELIDIDINNVVSIGEGAFLANNMNSFILPSVKKCGKRSSWSNGSYGGEVSNLDIGYKLNGVIILSEEDQTVKVENGEVIYWFFDMASANHLIIPDHYYNQTITSIGEEAFQQQLLKSVVIPETVTRIEKQAFQGNHLTCVSLPSGIKFIGDEAFSFNKISTKLVLPNGLDSIGAAAFKGNDLSSLIIPADIKHIGAAAFNGNSISIINNKKSDAIFFAKNMGGNQDLTRIVSYGDNAVDIDFIPSTVKIIDSAAFQGCNISGKVSIPNNVNRISHSAFANNNINTVTVLKGTDYLGDFSFFSNQISNINLPESITHIEAGAFNYNRINSVNSSSSDGIIYARNNDGSEDFTTIVSYGGENKIIDFIAPGVVNIGESAFRACLLTKVEIPTGVVNIENMAFYFNLLDNVVLSESVSFIGFAAFAISNYGLSITLPQVNIEGKTFEKWTNHENKIFKGGTNISGAQLWDEYTAHFTGDLSLLDISINNKIYPNPAIDNISIKSDINISKIEIYNQQGQLVLSSNKKQNINVSMLNSGIYIVKIITESGGVETQKIIKN